MLVKHSQKTMSEQVTIYLTEPDAQKFVLFQKYYLEFMLLVEKGVFDQKNAAISLHFDNTGTLQTIQRADFLYSKKHELDKNIIHSV